MPLVRTNTIQIELEKAESEYIAAKEKYDEAQVQFQTARDKFARVVSLASEIFSPHDWDKWKHAHHRVRFVGTPIKEAIIDILRGAAYRAANDHLVKAKPKFSPNLTLHQIAEALDEGGFNFRSTTPVREVNAALVNLKGVTHVSTGQYQIANAIGILKDVKQLVEESKTA